MKPRVAEAYTLYKIAFTVDKPVIYTDYTGKLVKTILARASRRLAEIIASRNPREPKPVSISPVYIEDEKTLKALYPRARGPREPGGSVTLHPGRSYTFYLAAASPAEDAVQEALINLFAGVEVETRVSKTLVQARRMETLARYSPHTGPLYQLEPGSWVKIVLSSPTTPSTPLLPGSRVKRLTPAPTHLLGANLLALYRQPSISLLQALELLTPPPDTRGKLWTTWYIYDGKPLPGLAGYIVYQVDPTARLPEKDLEDRLETLAHTLSHAAVMGVGTSRATGLGRAFIETRPPAQPPEEAGEATPQAAQPQQPRRGTAEASNA